MTSEPQKITELPAMTTLASGDLIPIVDVSEAAVTDQNKKSSLLKLDERWGNTYQSHTQPGAGAVARTYAARAGDWVNVKDFGAVADGVTDDTAAFNAMFATIRATGSTRLLAIIPPGKYAINGSINATSIRKATFVHVNAHGAELITRSTGKATLDMANSTRMVINGLTIAAPDSAAKPRVAVQIGRTETGTVAERMCFNDCKFFGFYQLASLYSYASEMLTANETWFSCIAGPSVIIDEMNYYGIASDHTPINVTRNLRRSCNKHAFNGCILGLGGVAANLPFYSSAPPTAGTYALMLVGNTDEVTLDRCYYLGYETSAIKVGGVIATTRLKQLTIIGHCEPDPDALIEFLPLPTELGGGTYVAQGCEVSEIQLSEGVMRSTQALLKNSFPNPGTVRLYDAKISVGQQGRTDRYVGSTATAPTQRPGGSALEDGDLWFNSSTQVMMLRSNGAWVTATITPLYLGEFTADPVDSDNSPLRTGAIYVNTSNPIKIIKEFVAVQVGATLVRQWQVAPTNGGTFFISSNIFNNTRFIVVGDIHVNDAGVYGLNIQRFNGMLSCIGAAAGMVLPTAGSYSYLDLQTGTVTTYGMPPNLSFASYSNGNTGSSVSRQLQDYDEGTFATAITAETQGNLVVTISNNNCRYVKVGSLVSVWLYVDFTPVFTTAAGALQFALPFTSKSGQRSVGAVGDLDPDFIFPVNARWVTALLVGNTRLVTLNYQTPGSAQNQLDMSELTSGTTYRISIQMQYVAAT